MKHSELVKAVSSLEVDDFDAMGRDGIPLTVHHVARYRQLMTGILCCRSGTNTWLYRKAVRRLKTDRRLILKSEVDKAIFGKNRRTE